MLTDTDLIAQLKGVGLTYLGQVHRNLPVAKLVEMALARQEAVLTNNGALIAYTGKRTGRSPSDKFVVQYPGSTSNSRVSWGKVNQPLDAERFARFRMRLAAYLQGRELFVLDAWGGADPEQRLPIRVVTEYAWHNLFARQLFRRTTPEEQAVHKPEFTVICAPHFYADPESDGTKSETAIVLDLEQRLVLICGTEYAGEIKKSIFGVLNYLLPQRGVFPMHCSANVGPDNDVALFFGLSGTGKTTLSADPYRRLIGDDEHGWGEHGVFNFEGGCYAKTINLSKEHEPQIWEAIRFGTVLENVVVDRETCEPNYSDDSITENTRAAYPIEYIPGAVLEGTAGHPRVIFFLTADAFGVLPPISRLTREQAMYHFLSGYTAKLAGTEAGMGRDPEATFSTCFGAPFLPLPPTTYAHMLGEKMDFHKTQVFLVNTGWLGGLAGQVDRIKLSYTRQMIRAALSGALNEVETFTDPIFGLHVPVKIEGVPDNLLRPRESWSNPEEYDRYARELAQRFHENFRQFDGVAASVRNAGPRI
jgi:phosphoenolpyruvate carboxykinase (ATP)